MKKLIFIFLVLVGSLAFGQEDVPYDMLGIWLNGEGEALKIYREQDEIVFQRRTSSQILSTGVIVLEDGRIKVKRYDIKDQYSLAFFVGNETMVVSKPRTNKAWLWTKVK